MEDERSNINKLNESLYSRTRYQAPDDRRTPLVASEAPDVSESFDSKSIDDMIKEDRRRNENHPIMAKMFTFALIFCLAAAAVAGYIYLAGGNLISSKNVEISVLGPVSVAAGAPLELGVTISNKNNADLATVNMVVEYPEGTRSAEDSTKTLARDKVAVGAIAAGASATRTERAILFGQKGDIKTVIINLEYRVQGSNAIFSKQKSYDISIGSAPVTMTVDEPPTVTSGNTFQTKITILANSSEILKDVLIRGEYPYGYSVSSAVPNPSAGDNIWSLGDLQPGEKREIVIKGILLGENQEERTFRFYAGVGKTGDPNKFESTLSLSTQTVQISRSSLSLAVSLNGENTSSYIAPAGNVIQGAVSYKNNLPTNASNGRIQVTLSGAALDKFSIQADKGGFYNSSNNTIEWNPSNYPELATLSPGESGQVSFAFSSLAVLPPGAKNNEMSLNTRLTADPSSGDTQSILTASATNSVKVASEVTLSAKALYSRGPFKNTGPIPPKAEKPTTYTLVLDLGNTQNDVTGAVVTGKLGPNVTWTDKTSVTGGQISYDPAANVLTWVVDKLPSGAGFSGKALEAVFQVSLNPSIGQVGSSPILVSGLSFSGTDSFTNSKVSFALPAVTTRITSDPAYVQGDDLVVK
ncbi:MAG: protein of unknown function with transrane region [Parcubacteria group bacterium]|nr:protein of unknown function with transrane region [Parcubacteria group bacterium]